MEKYIDLIDEIFEIRNRVNINGMSFFKMLYSINQEFAKKNMDKISNCEGRIQKLSEMLHMETKRSDLEILDEIEQIRAENNKYWMDVVRMCFEMDPDRARSIFYKIKECDKKIQSAYKELSNNEKN